LIQIGREALKRYRWSSYPWYLSRQCPGWRRREVVVGNLGLRPGDLILQQAFGQELLVFIYHGSD